MLMWHLELLEDKDLAQEIMETKESEKLLMLQQKITVPDDLLQQWFEGLKRILPESNTAKVRIEWAKSKGTDFSL